MIKVATAHTKSPAAPSKFFDRWADMATWPEWTTDTEWVRLDRPFAAGATGVLKPRGGPRVKFVVERLIPDREFTDVSRLLGARLTFCHLVTRSAGGMTAVDVIVTMAGPLAWFWNFVLGKGLRSTAQADLDRLAAAAEAAG